MLEIKKILGVLRGNRLLFLLGAVGLLLLLFAGFGGQKTETVSLLEETERYREALEARVAEACERIEGVGQASVFLSLSTTEIAVYEKNKSGESETVAFSGGEALLLAYQMPSVSGITVICEGGASLTVQRELYAFLRTAFALDATQIHVAPLS